MWAPEALSDDEEDYYYSTRASGSGSVTDDEEAREDIDAQEVYGAFVDLLLDAEN